MSVTEHLLDRTVISGDASLLVRVAGGYDSGPTLVVLHGGPGISHEYLLQLAQLATSNLRVIFYDQRQVGRSTGVAASSDPLREWADDLEAVRKALGTDKLHLLGHSAGGFVAMAYGSTYPEHTQSIIFVDSVPPTASDLSQAWERMLARLAKLQAAGLIQSDMPTVNPEDGTAFIRSDLPQVTPEDGTAFIRAVVPIVHFVKPADPSSLNGATYRPIVGERIMQALGDFDLRAAVSTLTMPTLSYISPIPFGVEMAGALYNALPKGNARRFTLDNCGHLPWVECPEAFFTEVRAFLKPFVEGVAAG
jgi:pimeloyl-ACP methyl ester carboxylesterase